MAGVLPPGVTPAPDDLWAGRSTSNTAFATWLAHQSPATRAYYLDKQAELTGSGSVDPVTGKRKASKKARQRVMAELQAAQEKALAAGEDLPGVDPNTGAGISFVDKQHELDYQKNAATRTAGKAQTRADALTPEQTTINPTFMPLDPQAAHPEDVVSHYGPAGTEQVDQEGAIDQTRTDKTGISAAEQSIQDETEAINQGGLTGVDRARLLESQMKRGMEARAQEQAIMQQAEQQGRAGSAAQLVSRQQAQQGSENAQAQDNTQTMALGLQRKDSLMGMRATQGMAVQSVNDALDNFNTKGKRDVAHANAMAGNLAHHSDIGAQREIDKGNVGITNTAIGQGMGYRSGRDQVNTGIANVAEGENKGPGYGGRAVLHEQAAADAGVGGAQTGAAGITQNGAILEANAKAQEAALPWEVAGAAVNTGVQVGKAFH